MLDLTSMVADLSEISINESDICIFSKIINLYLFNVSELKF